MPFLDVSDVILDADVAGTEFQVCRRREVVNDYGESTLPTVPSVWLPAVGSITPLGDNSLIREDAFASQANAIRVITTFALRGVGKDENGNEFQPDLVKYRLDNGHWSQEFTVTTVNDYQGFGQGFVEAECVSAEFQVGYPTTS